MTAAPSVVEMLARGYTRDQIQAYQAALDAELANAADQQTETRRAGSRRKT